MEQKEIIEGIKLIAKFDGKSIYPEKGTPEFKAWKGETCDFEWYQVKYNSSWDWLMPVIDKIENIGMDGFKCFAVDIENNECEIKDYREGQSSVSYCEEETKILSVFMAVVEFIKWFNNEKNN